MLNLAELPVYTFLIGEKEYELDPFDLAFELHRLRQDKIEDPRALRDLIKQQTGIEKISTLQAAVLASDATRFVADQEEKLKNSFSPSSSSTTTTESPSENTEDSMPEPASD